MLAKHYYKLFSYIPTTSMRTPVLIIGSGLAGLTTAYRLAQRGIQSVVVSKDSSVIDGTNSVYAQGGIIYRPSDDSAELLVQDILAAGDQINSKNAVHQLATEGVEYVRKVLIDDVQVPFDREEGDQLSFTQEAAHSRKRIIHVKDHTGKAIMESLLRATQGNPHITFLTDHILVDLLTSGHHCAGYEFKYETNRCLGAFLFDAKSKLVKKVLAEVTVLATGGIGQVYEYHTNAAHAYGGGLAAANRARVRIINSRFVQFHPTALWTPKKGRRFLISEALRGEGARLMNQSGEYFMDKYPLKDLESRAVVSHAIMDELKRTGSEYVLLNIADHYTGDIPLDERFPSIYQQCLSEGIDITQEPIPVIPAEHFFCGGIAVDLNGKSELEGLYAAGEVSCTGVHGANRLASTSLLECLTWGVKVGDSISSQLAVGSWQMTEKEFDCELQTANSQLQRAFALVEDWQSFGDQVADEEEIEIEKDRIRSLMWENVGIIRTKERLFRAKEELQLIWKSVEKKYSESALSEPLIELRHMAETAWIITNSASSHTNLMKDSLGGHVLE
jgi:L-aspartate oxidase